MTSDVDVCARANILSLCSGSGALDLAVRLALPAARTVCYVEIEAYACDVLVSRMEEGRLDAAPVFSDLRAFDGRPWRGYVDWIMAAIPANHSAWPGACAARTTHDTSGRSSATSSTLFDLQDASSKTSPTICDWASRKSPTTYTAWATELRRHSLQQRKSAQRTSASDSSSWPAGQSNWPTPDASVAQNGELPETWLARQAVMKAKGYNGNGCGTPLSMKVQMWTTPLADDALSTGGAASRDDGHQAMLNLQARRWPTPRTLTGGAETAERKQELGRTASGGSDLQAATEFWPTPNVPNGGRGLPKDTVIDGRTATSSGRKVQIELQHKAANWPTPRAEDSECCGNHPGSQDSLHGVTKQWPTPMAYSFGESHLPGQVALDRRAKAWPTPAARDWKDSEGMATSSTNADGSTRNRLDQLPRAAFDFHSSHPDQMTSTPGETSSLTGQTSHQRWPTMTVSDSHGSRNETSTRPTDRADNHHAGTTLTDAVLREDVIAGKVTTRRQLNPMFVEWLQNWPIGWSQSASIALTDYAS